MYYYKFESVDFEEQSAFELTHWKKFNPKELDEMVIKAIRTYVEEDYDTYQNFPGHLDIGDLFKIWGRYNPKLKYMSLPGLHCIIFPERIKCILL